MNYNLDNLDLKIISELMSNSRMPITKLAGKVRSSREVVTYRINKLLENKVILKFVTEINTDNLGFSAAAIFVSIKTRKEKEFRQYLNDCGFVSWVAELSGIWNFGLSVYGRDNKEIDINFSRIYERFKEDIIDHRFTLHRRSLFFYNKYFEATKQTPTGQKQKIRQKEQKIDGKDKIILKELANNSREDTVTLANKVSLTAPAVSQRIKKLENSGFIEKYSLFIDISKLNLSQYSILIINKNIRDKHKLIGYLSEHPKVTFIAEYVADPFMEFGLTVNSPYDVRRLLQQIEESFPDNRIIEASLFQKEFLSIGPPKIVFGD